MQNGRTTCTEQEQTLSTTLGRKRKRQDTSLEEEGGEKILASPLPPRKRVRYYRSQISAQISLAWNVFTDSIACWCAKCFLYAAELAAKSAKPCDLAQEDDLLQGLVQSLDCFQNIDMDILRRGWRVLCVCSTDCDPLSVPGLFGDDLNFEADVSVVLTAMERHLPSLSIQLLGFRALRTLLVKVGERWDAVEAAGAIPIFVKSMRIHSNDVVVQGLAITFLAMVVREVGSRPRQEAIDLGTVELVLRAMRNFDDDPRLLHTGCYALHQLNFIHRPREIILELGGIDLFMQSIERYIDDSDLVDLCLSALSKLSDEDNLNDRRLVPLVFKIIERWPNEPSIQGHNLVILLRAIGREPVPFQKVVRYVVRVMKTFPDKPSLHFFACATLREILERIQIQEIKDMVYKEGAIECVVQSVLKHRGTFGLQPMALLIIMNLWGHRTREEVQTSIAFGGNEHAIAAVTGMSLEVMNEDVHQH